MTWEWNFGSSGKFETIKEKRFPFGNVEIMLSSDKGRICDIKINGDFFGIKPVSEVENRLVGARLTGESLLPLLLDIGDYISGAYADLIANLIIF